MAFLAVGWLTLVVAMAVTTEVTGAHAPNRWLVPAGMLLALLGGALLANAREIADFLGAGGVDADRARRRTGMGPADLVRAVGWGRLVIGIFMALLGIALPPVTPQ